MDLNRKYAEHQKAVLKAAAAPDKVIRELHLDRASLIADEVLDFQERLGAAASCARSALSLDAAAKLAVEKA